MIDSSFISKFFCLILSEIIVKKSLYFLSGFSLLSLIKYLVRSAIKSIDFTSRNSKSKASIVFGGKKLKKRLNLKKYNFFLDYKIP